MLTHLTSTTGHVARTPRADVADEVIALLAPIVAAGGGQVPHTPEWHLDLWPEAGWAAFQLARGPASSEAGKRPYFMAVACWQEDVTPEAWAQAHKLAQLAPPDQLPADPPPLPWLSVTLLPAVLLLPRERIGMLGDLERCVAWTLVEQTAT